MSSSAMTQLDLEVCKGLAKVLKSGKNSKFNALFLNAFDLKDTPGYLDICGRAMDLATLSHNIETGVYSNREQVYDDCNRIFENAIKYHSDKDTTKWIVSPAQHMLKIAKREQQKIETKIAKGMTTGSSALPKLKLKLGGDKAKTTKIKIKQPAARATGATIGRGKTPPTGAAAASRGKTPPAGIKLNINTSPGSKPPPNKKPRLTLKLGLGKSNSGITKKGAAKINPAGGSRGKELPKGVAHTSAGKALPKGVVAETKTKAGKTKSATTKSITPKGSTTKTKASTAKQSTSKSKKLTSKTKITIKGSSAYKSTAGGLPMTPARKAQCWKILNGLKRRKANSIVWFEKPVSDKKLIQDYKAKIKYPMDLSTMQTKLENTTFGAGGTVGRSGSGSKGGYTTVAAFVWDIRRIFGNCLRYNTTNGTGSLRPIAIETLETVDQLCTFFLAKHEHQQNPSPTTPLYPPLLFCWKLCVNVIDTLYNLTNKEDRNPTAYYFMHPVSFFFGGTLPADYLHKAPKPMDFGTVTSQLMEGQYKTLDQFQSDCRLVITNCIAYYGGMADTSFCDQASRLSQVLEQQLGGLNRYMKSSAGLSAQNAAVLGISTATLLPKPQIPLLLSILVELRDQKYTDKATKITEAAMANFEKPVSVAVFPDYMQYVQTPMDLQTVERKIKTVQYPTPEDFEYDMLLMFQNCITYNGSAGRKMDHLVTLGKFGLKAFRRIFNARMKVLDDQQGAYSSSGVTRKDPPASEVEQGPSKRIKLDSLARVGTVRNAPRISLSAATLSEAAAAQRKKAEAKSNQPVPLHIAIARVKERFPLRRDVKSLQSWEAACARFFKELKRHPWISAARPKFIFHVPVPVLFPVSWQQILNCNDFSSPSLS